MEEISQIAECIRQLNMYSERCDHTTASIIRKIMKILLKYVTVKHRQGFNPINQNHQNKLDIYITRIQNDITADILFSVQEAATTIRDDQSMSMQRFITHDNLMSVHNAMMGRHVMDHMMGRHVIDHMIDPHMMGRHVIDHMIDPHMMGRHVIDHMMDHRVMDQHMIDPHMMGRHVMDHMMDQDMMSSNDDDCEQYAKLLKEQPHDDMIRNHLSEIETKYANLRHESNNIRIRLSELELDPNENAENIYNLVARLAIITEQTSKFEKRNGGGAGKF
jgi:hypothetical protein